jgi:hypothetical protein
VSKGAIESDVATFSVADFAPGSDIEILLYTSGAGVPKMLVSACGSATKSDPGVLPLLIERSAESYLVEHELTVLWVGLGAWLILILLMFFARRSNLRRQECHALRIYD